MANPAGKGGFKSGQSGNPGGRPAVSAELRVLAREQTEVALKALTEIVQNPKAPPAARVAAANSLLDRGYGRPEAFTNARIQTEVATHLDYSVFSAEEIELLDKITPLLGRPGFMITDDSNGSPAA